MKIKIEKNKYDDLLTAYQALERKKEKNRIANRKYKKTAKGKQAMERAKRKYRNKMKISKTC